MIDTKACLKSFQTGFCLVDSFVYRNLSGLLTRENLQFEEFKNLDAHAYGRYDGGAGRTDEADTGRRAND
ncbi:hypothetical protein, partial [Neisseria dentiae]|uniref:hypothetical protein n=1 Tax=Neisseria dentiae TaxID=194197 RepID=UPI0027DF488A